MARRLLVKITFSREHAKQQLSMNKMMSYLLTSSTPFIEEIELMPMAQMSQSEWQTIADGNYSVLIYFVKKNPHESGHESHKDTRVRRINSKLVSYPNISPQV